MPQQTIRIDFTEGLNTAQRQAVQHPPNVPLQILAGPGSGKTKVLTSRIAHLVTAHNIPPESICAVTFTNKAANEMRARLEKLIGKHITGQIVMGTFHAICAMFLRKHATLIGIGTNFTVCDADESKKIVTKLLKPYSDYLEERNVILKEATILSRISKAKAKGLAPEDLALGRTKTSVLKSNKMDTMDQNEIIATVVAEVYEQYEKVLKRSNSLDFDDLLVYGVKLFRDHRKVGKWCRHVLVDEFQDTNTVQYELMTHIAHANRCISVVVYGWRSAEVENLSRMQKDFSSTRQIFLEQNYRSTGAILATSVAIISQGMFAISVLHEQAEASSIAAEIKRIVSCSGGMLSYSDFAILLRMNSLSRAIESALQLEGIPHAVLGGHRFFDRTEVKDLVAYLQVVDNPHFAPAFVRVINIPITELIARASKLQISPLEVVEQIYDGKIPDIKPPVKRKVTSFVQTIRTLRKMATDGENPGDIVKRLIELIEYQDHLKKHNDDWESRWDNVDELVNFASEFECISSSSDVAKAQDDWMDTVDDEDTFAESGLPPHSETPLRAFLQASMLATDTETGKDDSAQKDRVTIATCHAAKGLEWPVVFIPAVEKGVFPLSRAEDIEEERRLLYVACTRAQGLLYMSHCVSRMAAGTVKQSSLSGFLTALSANETLLKSHMAGLTNEDWKILATVMNRSIPSADEMSKGLHEYRVQRKPSEWSFDAPELENSWIRSETFSNRPVSHEPRQEPGSIFGRPFATFTSAKISMPSASYSRASSAHQANALGPTRLGANVPGAPKIAAIAAKSQGARQATLGSIGSYMKPSSAGPPNGRQPGRRVQREQSMDMPDVSVDNSGTYSSAAPKSRGLPRTSNQNIAPTVPSAPSRPTFRPKITSPVRVSHASPSATSVPTPPNQTSVRSAGTVNDISDQPTVPTKVTGKRRLGMTGTFVPYSNKKFKPPIM
ncbi:hypothetical protein EIP86_002710 [Pleurotus ostreatoroseus]|nr:hypothetical protein EIP86_002710 [Pleurotus ostreatoroseus]